MIDLHVHTNRDDGKLSIEETVKKAVDQNIDALAIVTHDSVDNIEDAVNECSKNGIRGLAVVELTSHDTHYLLFLPDYSVMKDFELIGRLHQVYITRKLRMLELALKTKYEPMKLKIPGQGWIDFKLNMDELQEEVPHGKYMTGHLAQLLSNQLNGTVSRNEAYKILHQELKNVGYDKNELYVQSLLDFEQVKQLKEKFSGVLIEAHPHTFNENYAKNKLELGVDGFELSTKRTVQFNRKIIEASKALGFLLTIGSDNHMWDSDRLGFLNYQPELTEDIDEQTIVAELQDKLKPNY